MGYGLVGFDFYRFGLLWFDFVGFGFVGLGLGLSGLVPFCRVLFGFIISDLV